MSRVLTSSIAAIASAVLLTLGACDNDGSVLEGQRCEDNSECESGCYCWNDICVKEGALEFSLVWTSATDLDLYVETPSGETLGWSAMAAAGGYYSVFDCYEGDCTIDSGNHVEHTFFPDPPDEGTYEIFVDNYDGMDAADYTVEVLKYGEEVETFTGSLPQSQISSEHFLYEYSE